MQNFLQKSRQSSIVFEKPGFLSKKFKTLTSSSIEFNILIFFAETLHTFPNYLTMSTKGCSGFVLFCLDLEFLEK